MKTNIFLSYYHEDKKYCEEFQDQFHSLCKNAPKRLSNLDNSGEYINTLIENGHITNSTVVIVLVGPKSYKRKHVDWDIYTALKEKSPLMGITLPNRNDYRLANFITQTIPHRLMDNVKQNYATLNKWTTDLNKMDNIITNAIKKSKENNKLIDNRRKIQDKDYAFCGATGCECH